MRKSDRSRALPVALTLTAVLTGASCTGQDRGGPPPSAAHDGPLSLGGEEGTLCIQAGPTRDYMLGFDAVRNTTDADIQVNQVALVGATGATMTGGYLAPIRNNSLLGAIPGWPPPETDMAAFNAKKTIPAPVPAGQAANLLVHLQASAPAKVQAVEVTYTSDGKKWRVRNTTGLEIEPVCK